MKAHEHRDSSSISARRLLATLFGVTSHYFSRHTEDDAPTALYQIDVSILGQDLRFATGNGVFFAQGIGRRLAHFAGKRRFDERPNHRRSGLRLGRRRLRSCERAKRRAGLRLRHQFSRHATGAKKPRNQRFKQRARLVRRRFFVGARRFFRRDFV